MKIQHYFSASAFVLLLAACSSAGKLGTTALQQPVNYSLGGKMMSSVFQQRAAEYRALCLQGYNLALFQIKTYVPQTNKPLAIITDIDETILDNSAYAVHQVLQGREYDGESWRNWTGMAMADTMPGAAAFLKQASAAGVQIFYITNREVPETQGTLQNLQKFNLPNADADHLFVRTKEGSKETRRQIVMQNNEVVLLMGDNLADFAAVFDKKTEAERAEAVTNLSGLFGRKFIVFPNANYGDWEGALYKYKYNYTPAQKDSVIRAALKTY